MQHVIVCYGPELGYYHGAKLQILKCFAWYSRSHICVVTERPELFDGYPCRIIALTPKLIKKWSLDRTDHFGIKIQGLLSAIETASSEIQASLLLDTDMFWTKDPLLVSSYLTTNTAALYQNEGPIYNSRNKSIQQFQMALENTPIPIRHEPYLLSKYSQMWGSALIGIHHKNRSLLLDAFELFKKISPRVAAHTCEQFALAETLRLNNKKILAAKPFTANWSSTGRKNFVTPLLAAYFGKYGEKNFQLHLSTFHEIRLIRPLSVLFKQKIARW